MWITLIWDANVRFSIRQVFVDDVAFANILDSDKMLIYKFSISYPNNNLSDYIFIEYAEYSDINSWNFSWLLLSYKQLNTVSIV